MEDHPLPKCPKIKSSIPTMTIAKSAICNRGSQAMRINLEAIRIRSNKKELSHRSGSKASLQLKIY